LIAVRVVTVMIRLLTFGDEYWINGRLQ